MLQDTMAYTKLFKVRRSCSILLFCPVNVSIITRFCCLTGYLSSFFTFFAKGQTIYLRGSTIFLMSYQWFSRNVTSHLATSSLSLDDFFFFVHLSLTLLLFFSSFSANCNSALVTFLVVARTTSATCALLQKLFFLTKQNPFPVSKFERL